MNKESKNRRVARQNVTAGKRLRSAMRAERPLQVIGVINAYAAILAERAGFRALYLSGAGVANASYGVPDIGITTLEDVLIDVRRVTAATRLPLLVDADTGWENARKTASEMIRAGAAGIQLEDQVASKRCGHLPNKKLVSAEAMVGRLRAALAGRTDPSFVIVARTDAVATEGVDSAIRRARSYRDAGADVIFAEALTTLEEYRRFVDGVRAPVLANITEFGRTPLYALDQLGTAGIRLALYPLSGFRAMNGAALRVMKTIREKGTQRGVLPLMQTRAELYESLNYKVT